jgi:hypothetical protein
MNPGNLRERLLAAIDLMEFGIDLMRQNFRRRHPQASEEEIEMMLQSWLSEEPAGLRYIDESELTNFE